MTGIGLLSNWQEPSLGPCTMTRAIMIGNAKLQVLPLPTKVLKSKVILHPEVKHDDARHQKHERYRVDASFHVFL